MREHSCSDSTPPLVVEIEMPCARALRAFKSFFTRKRLDKVSRHGPPTRRICGETVAALFGAVNKHSTMGSVRLDGPRHRPASVRAVAGETPSLDLPEC